MKRSLALLVLAASALLSPRPAAAQAASVGTANAALNQPVAVALDGTQTRYIAEYAGGRVLRVNPDGTLTVVATSPYPLAGLAVAYDGSSTIYATDVTRHRIKMIASDGTVTTVAGATQGYADGSGASAQFNSPCGLVMGQDGMLYVADRDNHRIRRVDPKTGDVTTVAGSTPGFTDGVGTAAQFNAPVAVTIDPAGNLYVADTGNHAVRKIKTSGQVITMAGNGTAGFADGATSAAQFNTPQGITVDMTGWIYVGDTGNNRIRLVSPAGVVSTQAGNGTAGYVDGGALSAEFSAPMGVVVGQHGSVYVADSANAAIRKVYSEANAPTVTGVSPSSGPIGGGNTVTITGANFVAPVTVAFGGARGANPIVVDSNTITVTTPQNPVGTIAVAVRNPDGQVDTFFNGYSFYQQPASMAFQGLAQTFNGTPRPVTVQTDPAGLSVSITYTGAQGTFYGPSSMAPVNGGTYTVLAVIMDPVYAGTATGTLTVTVPPVVAVDLNGTHASSRVVFREATGEWFVAPGTTPIVFGQTGDVPVPADYNGDGKVELAVFRPSTCEWIVKDGVTTVFGQPGDSPVPGDYNGDGRAEMAVFRPSTGEWLIQGLNWTTMWGMRGDIPAPADYNGDGVIEYAVFRPTTGIWYIKGIGNLQWGMWGDVPVAADYNGDGKAEIAVYRPSTGWWYVALGAWAWWGAPGDIPVPLDLNGDGKTEFVVFRPSDGTWYSLDPDLGVSTSVPWGTSGDIPVGQAPRLPNTAVARTPGDFDRDGSADITIFRPSDGGWYTLESTFAYREYTSTFFGQAGDVPVPGDYQGNGRQEHAVYRPSTGQWLLEDGRTFTLGAAGDIPVPADYDGDGIMDLGVFTPGTATWTGLMSASGYTQTNSMTWGAPGDEPMPGDYDGDGHAELAVFTPATGHWSVFNTESGTEILSMTWGMSGDIPVASDFDGDGKTDIGVYRGSNGWWYGLFSSQDYAPQTLHWGAPGDIPVPGDYNGDGQMDLAVYRPSTGTWYVNEVVTIVGWGTATDVPVLGKR